MNIQLYKLMMVKEKSVRYELEDRLISRPENAVNLINAICNLNQCSEEYFYMICLNVKNRVIGVHLISKGTLDTTIVHPREIFKTAILNNASSIMLIHNHPSGNATPSTEDIKMTQRIQQSCEIIGIDLMDHLIVADDSYASFKELGLLSS